MAVATLQKCPAGKTDRMVWIHNMETCSEGGKCLHVCKYNKPEPKERKAEIWLKSRQ